MRYLAGLARQWGLPLAGENTGGGGPAALQLTLSVADELHLSGVMWMSGNDLARGRDGLTIDGIGPALAANHFVP